MLWWRYQKTANNIISASENDFFIYSLLKNKICHRESLLSRSVTSDSLRPMHCSRPGSSVHGDSLGKNTGVGFHALLQGIFPTQGSKPDLSHCRRTLYRLGHQGSLTGVGSHSLLQGIFPTQGPNQGLPHCGWILLSSANQARPRLASEIRQDRAHSGWFGHRHMWILYQLSCQGSPINLYLFGEDNSS